MTADAGPDSLQSNASAALATPQAAPHSDDSNKPSDTPQIETTNKSGSAAHLSLPTGVMPLAGLAENSGDDFASEGVIRVKVLPLESVPASPSGSRNENVESQSESAVLGPLGSSILYPDVSAPSQPTVPQPATDITGSEHMSPVVVVPTVRQHHDPAAPPPRDKSPTPEKPKGASAGSVAGQESSHDEPRTSLDGSRDLDGTAQIITANDLVVHARPHHAKELELSRQRSSMSFFRDAMLTEDGFRQSDARVGRPMQEWNMTNRVLLHVLLWLLMAVDAMQESVVVNLSPYITSELGGHSFATTVFIAVDATVAIVYALLSKAVAGGASIRYSYLYTGGLVLGTVGLVLLATAKSLFMYSAANLCYCVGFACISLAVNALVWDTTQARYLVLVHAIQTSPKLASTLTGPALAQGFLNIRWRWGYGTFSIILPFLGSVMAWILWYYDRLGQRRVALKRAKEDKAAAEEEKAAQKEQKASDESREVREEETPEDTDSDKKGDSETTDSPPRSKFRRATRAATNFFFKWDVGGILLFYTGFALFLIAFAIAETAPDAWRSSYILAMLFTGFAAFFVFGIVEYYTSPKNRFLPIGLMHNKSIGGACGLTFACAVALYSWKSYFTSYLQVVHDCSVIVAGYIAVINEASEALWAFGIAYLVIKEWPYKPTLVVAFPVYCVGIGTMLLFRKPAHPLGFVALSQVLVAIAGAAINTLDRLTVINSADEDAHVASMVTLLMTFTYVGRAIGNALSGAVWANTLPKKLRELLPDEHRPEWREIYKDLNKQLSYPQGSATRTAIQAAYGHAQKRMLIGGTAVMAIAFLSILFIRNDVVKSRKIDQLDPNDPNQKAENEQQEQL